MEHLKRINGKESDILLNKFLSTINPNPTIRINYEELNKKHPQEKFLELFKTGIRNSNNNIIKYDM